MLRTRIIEARTLPAQTWRNGGGQTRELLTWPGEAWRLRISLASITQDGPFSAFAGVERHIALIQGAGVRLYIAGATHALTPSSGPLTFDGSVPARAELIDGPTLDLNLMTAGGHGAMRAARPGQSWSAPLAQRGVFTITAGTLHMGRAPVLTLPAHTLFWHEAPSSGPWYFEPFGDTTAPPAWWLHYAPAAAAPDQ